MIFCRIAFTLITDPAAEFVWGDVREVVIGRIRSMREYRADDSEDMTVLSLNVLPGQVINDQPTDR